VSPFREIDQRLQRLRELWRELQRTPVKSLSTTHWENRSARSQTRTKRSSMLSKNRRSPVTDFQAKTIPGV
jgi:hypothetical protein